jgi:hypothetical protein
MKNRILLFAALIVSTLAVAQEKPTFGVRGGFTSTGMKGEAVNNLQNLLDFTDGMVTTSNRSGFFAGGYVNIPVSDVFSVEPALYYSQKGYEMRGEFNLKGVDFLGASATARLNTQYIDMPVLLKANVNGFQFFAGPQVSYLAQADLKTSAGVLGFNLLNKTMDATQQFNRWDVALTGGVGYQFKNGVNVMAAYDHGLSRVDANKNVESYNRGFKVGVGVSF